MVPTPCCQWAQRPQRPAGACDSRHKRRHCSVEVCCLPSPIWHACVPLLTSYAQGRPPCRAETCDAQYVEQPGHDPLTAATTQCHHDQGTPSASPTTIIDPGQPQPHAEVCDTKLARRSGHDPPTAVMMHDDNDCNQGPPIAPSTPAVDQTQGPRHCTQVRVSAHQQHPPPPHTTTANGRKPQRCTEACNAESVG